MTATTSSSVWLIMLAWLMAHPLVLFWKAKRVLQSHCSYAITTKVAWQNWKNGTFDVAVAELLVTKYFKITSKNCSERTTAAHAACCYLTEHEEHALVQLCTVLGTMGYGLTCNDLHSFADSIVNENVDSHEHVAISKHVTDGILAWHKDLVKIVSAGSLDPKQVWQATEETRDAVLLNWILTYRCYILWTNKFHGSHMMRFQHILYTIWMSLETTQQSTGTKFFCIKTDCATGEVNKTRTFMHTCEGDGQMPWHITVCLTTCMDGKYIWFGWLLNGFGGWWVGKYWEYSLTL